LKPTVWTLHDPWAITGHCIYPRDCEKWLKICENCPDLNTHFPMIKDNTKKMWRLKKLIYRISRFEIVVASNWMLKNVERSPLFKNKKAHYIPHGINSKIFYPKIGSLSKAELGIDDNFTILFRANKSEFKGFSFIKDALIKYSKQNEQKINVLTVEQSGLLDDLKGYFNIIEFGWVHDQNLMNLLFNAADVFLMPSTAEAFGLMAVEAMSCAKPVVVFKGTALPEIVNAPECGIAVDISSDALYEKIIFLMGNETYRKNIGSRALEFAQKNYNYDLHYNRIKNLYNEILKR
jgi:glycosyltransferase involved in cell wall biosynthesis